MSMKPVWTYDPATGIITRQDDNGTLHVADVFYGVLVYVTAALRSKWHSVVVNKAKVWKLEFTAVTVASGPAKQVKLPTESNEPKVLATLSQETHVDKDAVIEVVVDEPAPAPLPPPDPFKHLPKCTAMAIRRLRNSLGYPVEVETPAPVKPRGTTGAGDKTEAVVEWYLRFHPIEFIEKYGFYWEGTIEVIEHYTHPETKKVQKRRVREPGHFLSRRITHLTQARDGYERNRTDLEQ